jgi:hypothetical protein
MGPAHPQISSEMTLAGAATKFPVRLFPILSIVTVVHTPIFAATWSPTDASPSNDRCREFGQSLIDRTAHETLNANVELDVFSGRPNPSWQLNAADIGEVINKLQQARQTHPVRRSEGKLGYRGVTLRINRGTQFDIWIINDGLILHEGTQLEDPNREIESLILHTMPKEIEDQVRGILPIRK